MKPSFELKANKTDITELIKNNLVSLSTSDSIGLDSDTLTIVLDDKDHLIEWPKKGVPLNLKLGFDGELVEKGLFTVDELDYAGDPDTLTIHCRAADLAKMNAIKNTKHWENHTLGSVCESMTRKYQLTLHADETAANIPVLHAYQIDETDLNFLARLAESHHALIQVKKGKLILAAVNRANEQQNKAGFVIDNSVSSTISTVKRNSYYYYYYYFGKYLGTLCVQLANRYQLSTDFDNTLKTINIRDIQRHETDFDFFNRIARKYKFSLSIKNGKLSLKKADSTGETPKTPSGKPLATVEIDRSEVNRPQYSERHTDEYSACIATYTHKKCQTFFGHKYCYGSEIKTIKRGTGDKIKDLGKFKDQAAATKAADDFYNNITGNSSLTLPLEAGRPDIMVGMRVILTGDFIERIRQQIWVVSQVDNSLDAGLKTSVKLVRSVEYAKLEREKKKK